MNLYQMKRLIRRYEVPLKLIVEEPAAIDPNSGIYRKTAPVTNDFRGAVVPMPARLVYESGGRYTREDHVLYSTWGLPNKAKVVFNGGIYSVEEKTDFTTYADFFQYVIRWVSAFD